MFELFSGDRRRAPHRSSIPVLISTAAHVIVLGVMLAIPILYVSADLPEIPDMLTFVVSAAPPPPPPPPPPPAAPAATPSKPKVTKPVPTSPRAAPVEAPREIVEETYVDIASEEGVLGGVEGGIPGGVIGGVLVDLPQPPPPPPPAPVAREPVRVGGDLKAPALVERVEPEYPPLAVRARVQGVVILEALVDRQGRVESVRVLRSIPLLDNAAIAAVRQWRYSPLMLNGQPERFVLTVTLSFGLST